MLNIVTLNPEENKMLAACVDLLTACENKRLADAKQWDLRNDKYAFEAFQPEWNAAFHNRTEKRKEFYAMVRENPEIAGDLIERLVKQLRKEDQI